MIHNLSDACRHCQRPLGIHTLIEYNVCVSQLGLDSPFHEVDGSNQEKLGLDPDVLVADHVTAKSLVSEAGVVGGARLVVPIVQLEFLSSGPKGPQPLPVVKVAFIGSLESVQKFGTLIRDTSRGAVNAAKKRAG